MADTSSRMLRLLSLLQTHRHWGGDELAERLAVSARTLRRDVERLRRLGYPVRAERGLGGGYQLAAGASLPPLVLDDDEAVALAVGLQTASRAGIEGLAESSVRALAKVVQVMPTRLRHRVEAITSMSSDFPWRTAGPSASADTLSTMAIACRDTERVRFDYTSAQGRQTSRYAEPHRLVPLGRRWYVVAYDLERHDWRSFRLDRLSEPVSTREPFRPREIPAQGAAAFVREGLGQRARPFEVVAVVDAPEGQVRERIGPWATIEPMDGQRCRVTVAAEAAEWAAMALGAAGAPFTLESSGPVRDVLADWARRFTDATH